MTAAAQRRGRPVGAIGAVALGLVVLAALGLDRLGGSGGGPAFSAVPDVLRAGAATVALFAACGYAPAHLLLAGPLRRDLALFVLPVGAMVSALGLTLLGVLHLPLEASVALLLGGGVVAGVVVHRRAGLRRPAPGDRAAEGVVRRTAWPLALAAVVAVLVASPQLRADSLATVLGANGDAHLATGAALLLQEEPPGAERIDLPIDRMPGVWASKYPIIYVLSGASTLSGLDPVQVFSTTIAVVAGLFALGLYLLARHVLEAGSGAALAGMGLAAADRLVYHLAQQPYYNHLWGLLSLPFVLVFGWRFVVAPDRGTFALLAGFGALSVFAYPLLAPFPALFLLVAGLRVWRARRRTGQRVGWLAALRLPRGRRWLILWVPVALVAAPTALLLAIFAAQKMQSAFLAVLPGGDLTPWSGDALGFMPLSFFLGVPASVGWLIVVPLALALVGLRSVPADARIALAAMLAALVAVAVWFDVVRNGGALFAFRSLSFFAPIAMLLAGVGAWTLLTRIGRAPRAVLAVGLAVLLAAMAVDVRSQLVTTFPHASREVWQLRDWSADLPPGSSVRIDVEPTGVAQWAGYMLAAHPQNASHPLLDFFPHPPKGRSADYAVVSPARAPEPDAAGPPLRSNRQFRLYRLASDLPGPDNASRRLVDPLEPRP